MADSKSTSPAKLPNPQHATEYNTQTMTWEHPAVAIAKDRLFYQANTRTIQKAVANAVAFGFVLFTRETYFYSLLLWNLRKLNKSIIQTTTTSGLSLPRAFDYLILSLAALFMFNVVSALRVIFFPSKPRYSSVPLTSKQRSLLQLDDSVGETVAEEKRISPTKKKPVSDAVVKSAPASIRGSPVSLPSTVRKEPLTERRLWTPSPSRHMVSASGSPENRIRHTSPLTESSREQVSLTDFIKKEKEREAKEKLYKSPPHFERRSSPFRMRMYLTCLFGAYRLCVANQAPNISPFQPATKSPVDYIETLKRKERTDIPAAVSIPFDDVCRRLQVSDSLLPACKRLRAWLREKVMRPLVQSMADVDKALQSENLGHLTVRRMTMLGPVGSDTLPAQATNGPLTLNDLQSRFGGVALVQQRLKFETYLLLPRGTMERRYIVDRIEELAGDVDLGPFTWDRGSVDAKRKWTPDLPSDAEIVFHLFCCHMDERMKDLAVYQSAHPFTSQFVVSSDKTSGKDDMLRLFVAQRYPLKLNLLIGKQAWEVFEGRNNLFYAILLMIRYYEQHSAGYLDAIYLGGSLGLLELFLSE